MLKIIYNKFLAIVAFSTFIFYLSWNMLYIISGHIPPSILYKLTGIPSPTTGMYRSFIGFITLDKDAFFTNNPFVIPFVILLLLTVAVLVEKLKKNQPLIINNCMGISYLLILVISEIWMLIN